MSGGLIKGPVDLVILCLAIAAAMFFPIPKDPWPQIGSSHWLFVRNGFEHKLYLRVLNQKMEESRDYTVAAKDSICTRLAFVDQRVFFLMKLDSVDDIGIGSRNIKGPGETWILLADTTRPAEPRCPFPPEKP